MFAAFPIASAGCSHASGDDVYRCDSGFLVALSGPPDFLRCLPCSFLFDLPVDRLPLGVVCGLAVLGG